MRNGGPAAQQVLEREPLVYGTDDLTDEPDSTISHNNLLVYLV